MRDFRAPLFTRLSFLGVLEITYSQDVTTDIDAKYVKRHDSVQGCAFSGSQNHTLTSKPLSPPKTAILGPDFDGVRDFKYAGKICSLRIGHVIRRMCSGCKCIVNGILWEMSELITRERIVVGSSNFVEGLIT